MKELIEKILSIGHVSYEVLLPVCGLYFSLVACQRLKAFLLHLFLFHITIEKLILQVKFINMWDPALLAINREGYSIKCNGQRGVVMTEKFRQATTVWFRKSFSLTLLCPCC